MLKTDLCHLRPSLPEGEPAREFLLFLQSLKYESTVFLDQDTGGERSGDMVALEVVQV